MKNVSKSTRGLILALVLCLLAGICGSMFQSNFGKTKVRELNIVSESGYELCMLAFIPKNATNENPAPTVLLQHGGNDDKYLMTRYAVELARRGYVAVTVDMYGMGASEKLPDSTWLTAGRGLYDAVRHVATWPFVDKNSVGVFGYSRGGKACGELMDLDNETLHIIKNIYLLFSDPIYRNADGEFIDTYGDRNVKVLADYYDEYFFTEKEDSGTYDNDKNRFLKTLTSPVDYINNKSAQSFLYFGVDPTGKELRAANTVYEKDYNGVTATRTIDVIDADHNFGHFDPRIMHNSLAFFADVMPSPIGINSGTGLYLACDVCALIGIIGLFMFMVNFCMVMTEKTKFFSVIKSTEPEIVTVDNQKDKTLFWVATALGVVFNIFVIWGINKLKLSAWHDTVFRSTAFVYTPMLCLMGSMFTLIISATLLNARASRKDQCDKVRLSRILPGWEVVLKTILVSLLASLGFCAIQAVVKYLFNFTYGFPLWRFEPIYADRIKYAILVLPMTSVFYVVMSISNDGLGYSSILGKKKRINMFLTGIVAALPMIILMAWFYITFRVTKWNPMFGGIATLGNSIYRMPGVILVMVMFSRIIYQKTGNVYLGGTICGAITAIWTVCVCEIRIPEVDEPFTISFSLIGLLILAVLVFAACLKYFSKVEKSMTETVAK